SMMSALYLSDRVSGIRPIGADASSTAHPAKSSNARLSVTTGVSTGTEMVFPPKLSSITSSPSPAVDSSDEPSDAEESAAVVSAAVSAESDSELEQDANTRDAAATEATRA